MAHSYGRCMFNFVSNCKSFPNWLNQRTYKYSYTSRWLLFPCIYMVYLFHSFIFSQSIHVLISPNKAVYLLSNLFAFYFFYLLYYGGEDLWNKAEVVQVSIPFLTLHKKALILLPFSIILAKKIFQKCT